MDLISFLFDFLLVDPMTNMLVALARLFGGSFGIAIIVFTLIMKVVTWPLTASQFKQSKAMQAMQPKIQELQKKYKGKDPKKLQQETMALYREAGFNPLGCLLPMLVQMPIWIALYQVINRSLGETPESLVTLSQQLYSWVPYVHTAVPLDNHLLYWNLGANDSTFVLPVLVAVTMYVQQKMITPAPTAATANSQAAQQQQMMTWMMPLVFGYMSLNFPAGLALYWAVSNIAGLVIQYFYLGRKVDWAGLLKPFPPSPAPAARGNTAQAARQQQAKKEQERRERDAEPDEAPPADIDGATARPAATTRSRGGRGRRHGRRRGKR